MKRKNNIFKKREEKSHQIWSQSNQIVFDIFSLADTILAIMRLVFSLYYYYNNPYLYRARKRPLFPLSLLALHFVVVC